MLTLRRVLSACGTLALLAGLFHCDVGIPRGYPTPDLSMDSDFDSGRGPEPDLSPRSAPTISAIAPPLGPNVGGTQLTISGTGFQAGAAVTVAGAACGAVTVVSATSVTCTAPARPKICGAVSMLLTNPDTQSVTSDLFVYRPTALAFVPGTNVPNGAGSRSAVWADVNGDYESTYKGDPKPICRSKTMLQGAKGKCSARLTVPAPTALYGAPRAAFIRRQRTA